MFKITLLNCTHAFSSPPSSLNESHHRRDFAIRSSASECKPVCLFNSASRIGSGLTRQPLGKMARLAVTKSPLKKVSA